MPTQPIYPTDLIQCQLAHLHAFAKGMSVYQQGEIAKEFYYVNRGLIGLYHTLDNGKESLVRLYQKGDYFGYRTLFGDDGYHCNAKVLVEAEIIRIKPKDIDTFFVEKAKSAYLRTLDRVIDSIYFLTENFPYYNWTHREIAEYAGCETETAIRITKELKRNGLLQDWHKQK